LFKQPNYQSPDTAGDVAGGLRTAPKGRAFGDSNSFISTQNMTGINLLADRVFPPLLDPHKGISKGYEHVQIIKPFAVDAAHPLFGSALAEALAAAVEGTSLHAGFTWAKWPSVVKNVPCWVLWW
jgi:hypothetical protein